MNYAEARQRQSDGRWDWSVRNGAVIRPSGYCAGPPPDDPGLIPAEHWRAHLEKIAPFRTKYHADGHATKEEAELCFYGYELDQHLHEVSCPPSEQHACQVPAETSDEPARDCGVWTQKAFAIGSYSTDLTWLCDAHRTRQVFEALHPFRPGRSRIYS